MIPWLAPKKGFDHLIQFFDAGHKHFYKGHKHFDKGHISDYPLSVGKDCTWEE